MTARPMTPNFCRVIIFGVDLNVGYLLLQVNAIPKK
jgi:hypothetical protein